MPSVPRAVAALIVILLAEVLNFQGVNLILGMGSLSYLIKILEICYVEKVIKISI